MAAKLLHSLADDNPDLQNQIGCMTGIFHIFDRQQFISGKLPNQRRLLPPSGASKWNRSLDDTSNVCNREPRENNSNKYVNEKQHRASAESSRASFSSFSRSSSFSSLDCGRIGQPEPPSLDRMIFPETPSRDHVTSPKKGRFSFDLRDVVKDSMYRDYRGLSDLSVQTTVKDEDLDYTSKLMDCKIKYLPRISLDSPESSSRSSIVDAKLTHLSENMPHPSRPPSLVAKLMGLDTLPNAKPSNENRLGPIKTFIVEDRPPCRSVRLPKSPKSSRKDPTSPKWRNGDRVMKPLSSAKCSMEPAPWKHVDASRVSLKQASKQAYFLSNTSSTSPSVYGEMDKILKDIEFKQSGKDLRALKQILEAMQEKDILGGRTIEEQSVIYKLRGSSPSKSSESPIVLMKPANKLVQKSGIPSSIIVIDEFSSSRRNSAGGRVIKDHNSIEGSRDQACTTSIDKRANNRNVRATSPQQGTKDNSTSAAKSSGSISPRLQQKKVEFDRRSRPPTPPSPPPPDSNKTRRQPTHSRQSSENGLQGRRRKPKTSFVKQNDDQLSEKYNNPANLSFRKENTYAQTDANLALETIEQVTPPEQPSPVSVLDSCSYVEDTPSPEKQLSQTLQGDSLAESNGNPREDLWNISELSTDTTVSELPSEISRKKLQSIDNLVQKLRCLNSTHDETKTDYIASLCENSNPDHRYISEILLASGLLLRDLSSGYTSFQLHPSGHPINPDLFFVLEQTKTSSLNEVINLSTRKPEKFHRKLLFDAVNDILTGKLSAQSDPWARPERLAKKTLNAQRLLRELCAEIERRQAKKQDSSLEEEEDGLKNILWEDVIHRSGNWTEFPGEFSRVVLDVERHIFKELVDEIVMAETIRAKPNRRSRKLFSK